MNDPKGWVSCHAKEGNGEFAGEYMKISFDFSIQCSTFKKVFVSQYGQKEWDRIFAKTILFQGARLLHLFEGVKCLTKGDWGLVLGKKAEPIPLQKIDGKWYLCDYSMAFVNDSTINYLKILFESHSAFMNKTRLLLKEETGGKTSLSEIKKLLSEANTDAEEKYKKFLGKNTGTTKKSKFTIRNIVRRALLDFVKKNQKMPEGLKSLYIKEDYSSMYDIYIGGTKHTPLVEVMEKGKLAKHLFGAGSTPKGTLREVAYLLGRGGYFPDRYVDCFCHANMSQKEYFESLQNLNREMIPFFMKVEVFWNKVTAEKLAKEFGVSPYLNFSYALLEGLEDAKISIDGNVAKVKVSGVAKPIVMKNENGVWRIWAPSVFGIDDNALEKEIHRLSDIADALGKTGRKLLPGEQSAAEIKKLFSEELEKAKAG
ncbi:MAG: hypothetical protein HN370_02870 [Phycisphaerales bacterium]|nr:hypothetical protein [Phycisphaerales bacterium]